MSDTVSREQVEQMIATAIRIERAAIADRVRQVHVYSTTQSSSDPCNPFGAGEIITKEDAEIFRNDIANAIDGGEF